MNAVNPVPSPAVASAGAEPSMEEILASIRRIIADDSAPKLRSDPEHEPADPSPPALASHTAHEPPASPRDGASCTAAPRVPPLEPLPGPADGPRHPLAPPAELADAPSAQPQPVPMASHEMHDAGRPSLIEALLKEPSKRAQSGQSENVVAPAEPERLLSAAADSSVTAAFNTLTASRFVDNSEQLMGLVRDMVRPLVKAWVDEHLPDMVERIVATEIARMARGGS